MVDLETIGTAAVLASPAVALQHFGAQFAIRIWVQSWQSGELRGLGQIVRLGSQVWLITTYCCSATLSNPLFVFKLVDRPDEHNSADRGMLFRYLEMSGVPYVYIKGRPAGLSPIPGHRR